VDVRALVSSVERYNGVLRVTPGNDFYVLGSHFTLEVDARFLLDVLPPIVMIEREPDRESIRWAVDRMLREMRDFKPGGTLVAQQVAYRLLVEALRLHIADETRKDTGWLFALADTRMATALSCIHERPAHSWTIEELARSVRNVKNRVCSNIQDECRRTGHGVPHAVADDPGRKSSAKKSEPIYSIAPLLGYQSESAFSAAFKRHWGRSPRQYLNRIRSELSASNISQ
jgi:AraC-like DNA-binding protein